MEEAQTNSNLRNGTGNWFLVPYLSKRLGYFKTVDREQGIGNRQLVPCSLFEKTSRIFQNCKIGNRESGTGNRKLVPYFGILY